jgi:GNAT superfamily N-acetyltransferase
MHVRAAPSVKLNKSTADEEYLQPLGQQLQLICSEDASAVSKDELLWLEERCILSTMMAASKGIKSGTSLSMASDMQPAHDIWTDRPLHCTKGTPVEQERRAFKLRVALESSTAVAAATCRADALPESLLDGYPGRRALLNRQEGGCRAPSRARRQKILVGLARASSDREFVGVVDQVVVLPELRRQGLGRRCVLPKSQMRTLWQEVTRNNKAPTAAALNIELQCHVYCLFPLSLRFWRVQNTGGITEKRRNCNLRHKVPCKNVVQHRHICWCNN